VQYLQREQQLKHKLELAHADKERAVEELQAMSSSRQRQATAQLEEGRARELRYQVEVRSVKADHQRLLAELAQTRRLLEESNREVDVSAGAVHNSIHQYLIINGCREHRPSLMRMPPSWLASTTYGPMLRTSTDSLL
jgi:hypothetical protein